MSLISKSQRCLLGQLLVRNIEDEIVRALKLRAARQGRSAEAEHREILREALGDEEAHPSFKEFLLSMPDVGEDTDFEVPRDLPRGVNL